MWKSQRDKLIARAKAIEAMPPSIEATKAALAWANAMMREQREAIREHRDIARRARLLGDDAVLYRDQDQIDAYSSAFMSASRVRDALLEELEEKTPLGETAPLLKDLFDRLSRREKP